MLEKQCSAMEGSLNALDADLVRQLELVQSSNAALAVVTEKARSIREEFESANGKLKELLKTIKSTTAACDKQRLSLEHLKIDRRKQVGKQKIQIRELVRRCFEAERSTECD